VNTDQPRVPRLTARTSVLATVHIYSNLSLNKQFVQRSIVKQLCPTTSTNIRSCTFGQLSSLSRSYNKVVLPLPRSPRTRRSNAAGVREVTKSRMANQDAQDALLLLRQCIATESPVIPTTTADASSAASVDLTLATATYLQFSYPSQISIPLITPTRFNSSEKPVDLRSIYFAWLKREVAIPEYNASALALNADLAAEGGPGGKVQVLTWVERLDLITWLEGASEESEHIKPLASDTSSAAASAQVASGAAGGVALIPSGGTGRLGKTIDPRLAEIYNGERRTGDRNSVLRGIKPTVCCSPLPSLYGEISC
jgi:hypothetical protein